MKKDSPRSESEPLKFHISEIITALVTTLHCTAVLGGVANGTANTPLGAPQEGRGESGLWFLQQHGVTQASVARSGDIRLV